MSSLLRTVRRPEYTGERRCWPCTLVNGGLLLVACAALGAVGLWLPAVVLAVVGATAIALRGYLVPYTPTFAPRLAAALPGDVFDHEERSATGSLAGDEETAPDDVLETLVRAGVLVPEGEQLFLAEAFDERWQAEMDDLGQADLGTLADATSEVAPGGVDARADGEFVVLQASDSIISEQWLSRPVAIAEVAAARALADFVDDPATRTAAARPLRMFLDRCPDCGGQVVETTEANCCGGPPDKRAGPRDVLACEDCGVRLYTFPREA